MGSRVYGESRAFTGHGCGQEHQPQPPPFHAYFVRLDLKWPAAKAYEANRQNRSRLDSNLMSRAAEHRAALNKVQDGMVQVGERLTQAEIALNQRPSATFSHEKSSTHPSICQCSYYDKTEHHP